MESKHPRVEKQVRALVAVLVGEDPLAEQAEPELGLGSVAGVQSNVKEVVVFASDIQMVAHGRVEIATLEVQRSSLGVTTLHPSRCRTEVKRHANRCRVKATCSFVSHFGVVANTVEVTATKGYPSHVGKRVGH